MAEDSEQHWTVVVTYSLTAPGSVTDSKVLEQFYAVPELPAGSARVDAVARIVASVGVPVLFLGGPSDGRERVLAEVGDVMAGGGAGMAIGRTIYQDAHPGEMARLVAEAVRGDASSAA